MKNKNESNIIKKAASAVLTLGAAFTAYGLLSNKNIKITKYIVKSSKIPAPFNNFKILQISDIHAKVFGENNSELINKIYKSRPDIIVITGDAISRRQTDIQPFISFLGTIAADFRVYYVYGNHELDNDIIYTEEYNKMLKNTGAVLINDKKISIYKSDSEYINLYGIVLGLEEYIGIKSQDHKGEFVGNKNLLHDNFDRLNKNEYNILLAHNPTRFKAYASFGFDLILSGHMHGGMIRLPFFGGFLSPEQEFFPEFDKGKFVTYNKEKNVNSTMIVNSGLGNGTFPVRFFNPPEIAEIILKTK